MTPTAALIQPEVAELVREGAYSELRAALRGLPAADIADIITSLEPDHRAVCFRFLPRDDAGEVFSYLDAEVQEELILKLGDAALRVVEGMDPDDRVRLLDELPTEVAQRLIGSLSPEDRKQTQAILGYPPESVGRLMNPDYIRLKPDWTIGHALDHIRKYGHDAETINVVYVVDDNGVLIDDIRLRSLFLADPDAAVESLMNRNYVALRADQDQEEAVRMMARYDRIAMPVIDSRGVLLGIVTSDDIADVAEEEATEDIQKLGGVGALEQAYIQTGAMEMFRKRGVWLSALFIGQTITILVLGRFQDQLDKAVVLSLFMPLVMSCGGNSGSQAATLITRALALGEVGPRDWWRIARRELLSALLLAGALAAMGFVCVEAFVGAGIVKTSHVFPLAVTISMAVAFVVTWGTVLGSMLPLLLRRAGLDPATASTPMVATLMDASGTLIYLGVAVLLLTGTIL
ncbi:MAG: magnesium transporter [Phycisphaeraceae bacterium]|nr:magnesium transporter [Phycisphaeraceae bacterium]MBX3406581.1 magnesium transporter [Phycisphaeraceae bacterium]